MKSTRWYELTTFTHGYSTYIVYVKKRVNGLHKFKTKKVNRINSTFGINFHITAEQQQKNLEAMEKEFENLIYKQNKHSKYTEGGYQPKQDNLGIINPPRGASSHDINKFNKIRNYVEREITDLKYETLKGLNNKEMLDDFKGRLIAMESVRNFLNGLDDK